MYTGLRKEKKGRESKEEKEGRKVDERRGIEGTKITTIFQIT